MKVFGIGCPKTGTKTLGEALSLMGFKGVSWDLHLFRDVLAGRIQGAMECARYFDAFDDLPWCLLYRELDAAFPGSKFILTVRKDSETWLKSFQDHAVLAHGALLSDDGSRAEYGVLRDPLFPEGVRGYEAHNAAVQAYFRDRPGTLLTLCWEEGHGWKELAGFLGLPIPDAPFPHANPSRPSRVARKKALLRARRLLGLPPADTRKPYRVVSPTKRWDHHTRSGGYDRLPGALGAVELPRRPRSGFPAAVLRAWDKRWSGPRSLLLDYQPGDWCNELRILWRARRERATVVHVPYGDEQLDLLLRLRRLLPCLLTASFHLPEHLVERRLERQRSLLRRLDGAVVLSTSLLDEFRYWLGFKKVAYVPHGIDTDAFRPPSARAPSREARFLAVGSNGRDFETLRLVAARCARERLKVRLDAVLLPQERHELEGCGRVRLHSGVPEAELVSLYQRADALLLPMRYAVANNSVLESLACGTPVVTTDVGGVRDYVDETCAWLAPPGDSDAVFELVRALSREPEALRAKRAAARRRAELFSWDRVAGMLAEAHRRLLDTGEFAHYSGKWLWESRKAEIALEKQRRKEELARLEERRRAELDSRRRELWRKKRAAAEELLKLRDPGAASPG